MILPLPSLRGKEWRCPRHLMRSSSFPHLRVACVQGRFIASLDDSGPAGTQGRRAPARGSTRRPTIQHGAEAALEDTGGRPRRQSRMVLLCGGAVHHAGARCVASVWVWYCRELLGTVLDSVAEQSSLGDESVEKAPLVDFAPLSQGRALDGALGPHLWTSPSRRARSVAERSSCFNLGLVLPSCI